MNVAADALSRRLSGHPRTDGDGSAWTVSEDWESAHGIVNDLLLTETSSTEVKDLRSRFQHEPLLLEVVEALLNLDGEKPEKDRRRARHRALGYIIEDGRLWRIADGKSSRTQARRECILQEEAVEMAKVLHAKNGHWGHDLTKLQLMDHIFSPKLDKSIITALLQCPQCKNFGSAHLHVLMYPIT